MLNFPYPLQLTGPPQVPRFSTAVGGVAGASASGGIEDHGDVHPPFPQVNYDS